MAPAFWAPPLAGFFYDVLIEDARRAAPRIFKALHSRLAGLHCGQLGVEGENISQKSARETL